MSNIDAVDGVSPPPPATFAARFSLLATLAGPTMLSRAGILLMALADIVMVGRHSTQELAYASLGMSLFVPILVTGVGLMMGVTFLTSQHFGAGRLRETGKVWRRGLPWALAVGVVGGLICAFGEVWLGLLGHEPDLAAGGGAVAVAVAVGIPAQLLYAVCAFHLEATRRPLPGLIAMAAANLLNIALNWVLIYGNLGAPELGAVGSGIATAGVRVFLAAALVTYIVTRPDRAVYGIHLRPRRFWGEGGWGSSARLRRIGYAAGVAYGVETSAYALVLQFAGWLGAAPLAAYSIAHNIEATLFMAALGLGAGTAVMVGNAVGGRDYREAGASGRLGIVAVLVLMSLAALAIFASVSEIVGYYTLDPSLRALAAPVLMVAGLAAIFDGAQLVAGQCSRAMGDVWSATLR
ncbi:MAG: MATE family efflux transporter, partial [Rhodobacteraceae bacterium]|nr:MATE family efflux transporter [Paracoccaceae bacterium]